MFVVKMKVNKDSHTNEMLLESLTQAKTIIFTTPNGVKIFS